jgi:hypothetical protein
MIEFEEAARQRLGAPRLSGTVRLGVVEEVAGGSLPSALARFAALHRGVKLEVQFGVSMELIEQLNAGRLDAVFAYRPLGTAKGRPDASNNGEQTCSCLTAGRSCIPALPLAALPRLPPPPQSLPSPMHPRRARGRSLASTASSSAPSRSTVVSDGTLAFPAETPWGDRAEGARSLLTSTFHTSRPEVVQINTTLINIGDKLVLIDAGCGVDKFQNTTGRLLGNLAAAGYAPGDIDMILFTHFHFDHPWGITDGKNDRCCSRRPNS